MPISSLYSSILIVVRWADLISMFFGTYNGTLRQSGSGDSSVLIGIFCTSLAFQDRTPSPLPSPVLFFSCRLEASARGRWHPSIHPPLKLPTASTHGPMPPSSGVPLYIRPTNSRQHPPSDRCFLCPSIHPPHESTSPSRTRSVRLSPPLRYQSSTKESKELTGILPIIIWINAFFSSKRKV